MSDQDAKFAEKNRLSAHPAAERFPMMSAEEFEALKENIRDRGLLEAIWVFDGMILDGRNRYAACIALGIEPTLREYTGDSPFQFAWSMNGVRRQLSKSQLATIAVGFLPELREEAKRRVPRTEENRNLAPPVPGEQENHHKGEAISQAASIVGVGKTIVQEALAVSKEAPELFSRVQSGEISVERAMSKVRQSRREKTPDSADAVAERVAQITSLAADGHDADQISAATGIDREVVNKIAYDAHVAIPNRKRTRIRAGKVISETATALAGLVMGIELIDVGSSELSKEESRQCLDSISRSLSVIHRFKKQLAESLK